MHDSTTAALMQVANESAQSPHSGVSPFLTYRERLDTYHYALDAGLSDAGYCDLVTALDSALVPVEGHGFRPTPLFELDGPANDPRLDGSIWAKVETGNIGGSHKARHLFGLLVQIAVDERAGSNGRRTMGEVPLAIASCGNAALGAAVIARSIERTLQVYVPVDANPVVLSELERLGADVRICERVPGELGDPCLSGLDRAVAGGAQPFTVQGPICPGVIDGGRTLGLELADQLHERGIEPADLYIQIGGGALATSVCDGLDRSELLNTLPRLHPVQPAAAHPYVATWQRLRPALAAHAGVDPAPTTDRALARALRTTAVAGGFASLLAEADDAMEPWPGQPESVASGILDDITYDWKTVMAHQLRTGGWPIMPTESEFEEAVSIAAEAMNESSAVQSMPPPDATGAAGLAGLLADPERFDPNLGSAEGPALVILSGRRREEPT